MTANQVAGNLRTAVRASARLIGLVSIGLYFVFLIESGAQIMNSLSWNDFRGIPLFLALTLAVAGLAFAWRREAIGGLATVVGGALILTLVYLASGTGMTFTAFLLALPLLTAGLLHLVCAVWVRFEARLGSHAVEAGKSGQWALAGTAQAG